MGRNLVIFAVVIGIALLGGWFARDIGLPAGSFAVTQPSQHDNAQDKSSSAGDAADEPSWSPGPKHDAQENADYHWRKHGQEFSNDRSEQDYVTDAEKFVSHPPPGAQIKRDSRGDTLIYDSSTNTFAVRAPDGSPRTMFKPHIGEAYWNRKSAAE